MKNLLTLIFVILFISSCSTKPNDVIHDKKSEFSGWKVDKSVSENPIQKFDEYYQISPTWGQSIDYAVKSDDFPVSLAAGVVLLVFSVVLFMFKIKDSNLLSESADKSALYIAFVLLVGGLYAIYSKPGEIRFNNDKWVNKEVYDKAIKEAGSTQPIWDSLENNCLIVGKSCK